MFSRNGAAKVILAALVFCLLNGCAGSPFADRAATARSIASEKGWTGLVLKDAAFPLQAYISPPRPVDVLTIYIEGDGLAWRSRYVPSSDPTPRDPIGLRLAVADPAPGVAYLARPCQYQTSSMCTVGAWTGDRFSPAAIAATQGAIDRLKTMFSARRVLLAGYSGGGVMAAIVAAGRTDAAGLLTIAAPLDVGEWVRHHDVDPLSGSQDPVRCCQAALSRLPQRHVVGLKDDVVPRSVVESYRRSLSIGSSIGIVGVDSDHQCCYVSLWPGLAPQLRQAILTKEES